MADIAYILSTSLGTYYIGLCITASRGWEINKDLEKVVNISNLVTPEIVTEGEPDICDVGNTIEEFRCHAHGSHRDGWLQKYSFWL
jgi:hypothetical protein